MEEKQKAIINSFINNRYLFHELLLQIKNLLKEDESAKYIYNEGYHKVCELINIEESSYSSFYYDELLSIKEIKNKLNVLTEKQKYTIISGNPYLVFMFNNLSDKIIKKAISLNNSSILFLEKLSKELQIYAINKSENSALYIDKICAEAQELLVTKYKTGISYIKKPSEKIKTLAITTDNGAFHYLRNEDKSHKLATIALKGYGLALKYVKNPSKQQIITAILDYPTAARYVKNHPIEKKKDYLNLCKEKIKEKFENNTYITDERKYKIINSKISQIYGYLFKEEEQDKVNIVLFID